MVERRAGLLPDRLYPALLLVGVTLAGRLAWALLPPAVAAPGTAAGFEDPRAPAAGFGDPRAPAVGFGDPRAPAVGFGDPRAPAAGFGDRRAPDGRGSRGEALPAAAGGQVQALTDPRGMDGFPAFSPDARQIAFMRDGRIWLMGPGGEDPRPLTGAPDSWDVAPSWSPDGRWIAFIRYPVEGVSAGGAELRAVRPRGGRETVLLRSGEPIGAVAWSPDGKHLAYTTARAVRVLEVQSRNARPVVEAGPDDDLLPGGLAWSPDGQTLAYGVGRERQSSADPLQMDLYLVPAAGGQPRQLTSAGGIMPDFSPDGRQLAFRNPGRQSGIYVLDLATGRVSARVRDSGRYMFFHPRWSPDGRALLLSRLLLPVEHGDTHLISAIVVSR